MHHVCGRLATCSPCPQRTVGYVNGAEKNARLGLCDTIFNEVIPMCTSAVGATNLVYVVVDTQFGRLLFT